MHRERASHGKKFTYLKILLSFTLPLHSHFITASVRVWSHFYESCVDYPRSISIDSDAFALGVGESKGFLPQSETGKSLPARLKHIKNESVVSVFSERSVNSVRRSTVDLAKSLQQAERRERERVLTMVGAKCSA